jgi:hypothetical protein
VIEERTPPQTYHPLPDPAGGRQPVPSMTVKRRP